ncbi:DUF2452 domain-containing protein [bacterium]|nr:DUF2452 domain-containing protein [bacterium]
MNKDYELPEGKLAHPTHPGDAPFKALELDIKRLPDKREVVREVKSHAARKLELLEEMHKDLIQRARQIVDMAKEDLRLHDIPVHARKVRNKTYYLYHHPDVEDGSFFSILEPEDYLKADLNAEFLGAYQLNEDSSWTIMNLD